MTFSAWCEIRNISIHALREEGDASMSSPPSCRCSISIHALREEGDREKVKSITFKNGFLSTPSARRATQGGRRGHVSKKISIHALREEGDRSTSRTPARGSNFYPRPPRGGRRAVPGGTPKEK